MRRIEGDPPIIIRDFGEFEPGKVTFIPLTKNVPVTIRDPKKDEFIPKTTS